MLANQFLKSYPDKERPLEPEREREETDRERE